jgi:uncharacterized protein
VLLVDTSALLAGYDGSEKHHASCLRVLQQSRRRIVSPFVLAELDYLLFQVRGAVGQRAMLSDCARGVFEIASLAPADIEEAMGIIDQYAAMEIGLTDASIVVLAERHKCLDLLTLDQRHFRAIAGPGGKPFRILPFDE